MIAIYLFVQTTGTWLPLCASGTERDVSLLSALFRTLAAVVSLVAPCPAYHGSKSNYQHASPTSDWKRAARRGRN